MTPREINLIAEKVADIVLARLESRGDARLSASEAAKVVGVCPKTMKRQMQRYGGWIDGGRVWFSRNALERLAIRN